MSPTEAQQRLDHILAVGSDPHRTPQERLSAVLRMAGAALEEQRMRRHGTEAAVSIYDLLAIGLRMRVHVEIDAPDGGTATFDLHNVHASRDDDEATLTIASTYEDIRIPDTGLAYRTAEDNTVRLALSGALLAREDGEKFRLSVPTGQERLVRSPREAG